VRTLGWAKWSAEDLLSRLRNIAMNDYQEDLLDVHAADWEPAEPVDDATEL
jgi:hypothetical protein